MSFILNRQSLLWYILVLGLLAAVIFPAISKGEYPKRKIVVFKEHFVNQATQDELIARAGGTKIKDLPLIHGKAVFLSDKAAERALRDHPEISRIEDDVVVESLGNVKAAGVPKSQPVEVLPWGIDRIDAELVWPGGNTGDGVKVGIIDTGIDIKHPDLIDNIKGGVSTVGYTASFNDDNGHGTHVSGIVAAVDNTIGVVGVAPKVWLYGIKVLDRTGSGYLSDVIEGIQWAIANGMQVVNMSLGTSSDIQSFHDAVASAKNAGIVVVVAAGNSGGAVNFPAVYTEAIAVSATDQNNVIASWSSRGPEVDLAAPGVSIYSTYKGSAYKTLSGTSMAAPHVAGSAALVLKSPTDTAVDSFTGVCVAVYDTNCNNKWDPDEVQKKLQDKAVDIGASGFDFLYGWGLVNAFAATK